MISRRMVGPEALGQGEDTTHPQSLVLVGPPRTPGPWQDGGCQRDDAPAWPGPEARQQGRCALPGDSGHSCPQLPRQPRVTWVSSTSHGPGGGTVMAERQLLNNSAMLGILIPRGRPTASPSALHLGSPELLHTAEVPSAPSLGGNLLLQPCFPHSCDPATPASVIFLSSVPGGSDRQRTCLQCGKPGLDPWDGKIPWRREWQPTAVFLPGEFRGQRSLAGYSPWGCKESDMTERFSVTHSLSSVSHHQIFPIPSPKPLFMRSICLDSTLVQVNTILKPLTAPGWAPACRTVLFALRLIAHILPCFRRIPHSHILGSNPASYRRSPHPRWSHLYLQSRHFTSPPTPSCPPQPRHTQQDQYAVCYPQA